MGKDGEGIAIYSRKSKFTGKGESIGNQVELCREYIRAHYGGAAERIAVYEDEGFSGGDLNRPAFRRMMQAARERRFRAIVVYRLDRISRNISDFSGLIEELSRLGVAFVSIREQFDTDTPMGRAMMYIASVFSQLERETIAERIRDNMHELAKTGRWLGGVTPTGYVSESVKSMTVDGRTRRACRLKLVPEEAAVVRTIYALFAESQSLAATEAALLRRGLRSKNGRQFSRFSVKAILQNPVYLIADGEAYAYFTEKEAELFSGREAFDGEHGVLAYNRTDQEKGRATVFLPVRQWIVAVGQHPGLIPGREWVAVQEALERNRSAPRPPSPGSGALLTGLLYCRCGSRMYPKPGRRGTGEGPAPFSYVCKRKERSQRGLCGCKNAPGAALDRAVLAELRQLEEDAEELNGRLRQSRRRCAAAGAPQETALAALRREKAETEKKAEALVDSLAELGDGGAREAVAKRIGQLDQTCRELEGRIRELEELTPQRALEGAALAEAQRRLASLWDGVDAADMGQKRAVVRALVRRVVWDGAEARVFLYGAAEAGEEGVAPGTPKTQAGEDSK
ncbi:MAG: recombinase family protein [Oscillospiraceae bacterium]